MANAGGLLTHGPRVGRSNRTETQSAPVSVEVMIPCAEKDTFKAVGNEYYRSIERKQAPIAWARTLRECESMGGSTGRTPISARASDTAVMSVGLRTGVVSASSAWANTIRRAHVSVEAGPKRSQTRVTTSSR